MASNPALKEAISEDLAETISKGILYAILGESEIADAYAGLIRALTARAKEL